MQWFGKKGEEGKLEDGKKKKRGKGGEANGLSGTGGKREGEERH